MSLTGQRLVVIGGSSGIGLATVRLAAARGMQVVATGRDADRLSAVLAELAGEVSGEVADAADREALDALFARIDAFDHLVLAASGGRGAGPFASLAADDLRTGFEAKYWLHFHSVQAALKTLSPTGSVTFVTAASARLANPGTSGLAAINGALNAMVPTLARELAPRRVNAVSPGVVDTPWWADKPAAFFEQASPLWFTLAVGPFWVSVAGNLAPRHGEADPGFQNRAVTQGARVGCAFNRTNLKARCREILHLRGRAVGPGCKFLSSPRASGALRNGDLPRTATSADRIADRDATLAEGGLRRWRHCRTPRRTRLPRCSPLVGRACARRSASRSQPTYSAPGRLRAGALAKSNGEHLPFYGPLAVNLQAERRR